MDALTLRENDLLYSWKDYHCPFLLSVRERREAPSTVDIGSDSCLKTQQNDFFRVRLWSL